MDDGRLYAVNLLWVHDPDGFAEYQERAKPVLARHGVHIERWLMTEARDGNGGNGGAKLVHGSGGIVSLRAEQNSAT